MSRVLSENSGRNRQAGRERNNGAIAAKLKVSKCRVICIHITAAPLAAGYASAQGGRDIQGELSSANKFGSAPASLAFTSLGT